MSHIIDDPTPLSVRMAYEIVDLWEENAELRRLAKQGEEYRQKYMDLLNESVQRGQTDVGNWLQLLLSDRIKFVEPTNG